MASSISRDDVTVCVVGDFCLSGDRIAAELEATKVDPWSALRGVFVQGPAIVGNLECAFTSCSEGMPFKWANLKAAPALHWALDGMSIAVLGNNHIADFGAHGVAETQAVLARKRILSVGYGPTLSEALKPCFIDVNGCRVGVVSLCCPTTNGENLATHLTPGVAPLGMATLEQAVRTGRPECEALIVYLHWGCEWVHDVAPDQLRLARHAIDCGADAVVGCHSHTIQPYEEYRGRSIFYGLGNYLFAAEPIRVARTHGGIEYVAISEAPANRESLAVSFAIVRETGSGRLRLDRVQPMRFGADWVPRPITVSELTFDLEAANRRLQSYVARNQVFLCDRSEPVFRSKLRNGVVAYWYSTESIEEGSKGRVRRLVGCGGRRVGAMLGGARRRVLRYVGSAKSTFKKWCLSQRIRVKWYQDSRRLPLTRDHWELYGIIHRVYWEHLGDLPNLVNCRDFNDRMQWLKLFDQSEEIVRCSDKISVRDVVKERVGEQYRVTLYQVQKCFDDIDFDALPTAFVIKANHDSGTVILVRDKERLDRKQARARIEAALSTSYGWENGEWGYAYVEPKVLVEELIEPECSTPPPDYKFHSVDGSVRFVQFIFDRGSETKEQILDREGRDLGIGLYPRNKLAKGFKKPPEWEEMLRVAERLAGGFKYVRVDLYCPQGRILAGEMTFWPMMGCYQGEGQKKLGALLDFDRRTYRPLVHPRLARPR